MQVKLLGYAEDDLRDTRSYLTRTFGKASWQTAFKEIQSQLREIAINPSLGKIPEELRELGRPDIRQILCGPNRIIYQIVEDTVFVHVICHYRRDLKTLLAKRLLFSA